MSDKDGPRATFTDMAACTQEDWAAIVPHYLEFASALPERILRHLELLRGDYGGFPIDRLDHCLQTAALAHGDGRDEEYVVCALLHDVGDTLGAYNHADIAAAIVQPFVSPENHFMVQRHAIFQGYYFFHHIGLDRNLREQFRGNPHFDRTEEFCALYDNPAFDPRAETLPIADFEPMLRRVFGSVKNSVYKSSTAVAAVTAAA